ncbi:hypothetical protein DCAR_0623288 [Daucus carota subsp. sativus]|uniref:Protein kinase domain-containing protein n=1 Tax=Daucus carota subsp. sativus TaxID=79200 RepID=A0AAF0XBB2_DAUCS|nr:PREDICTED: lysM domain receptor-like kinase 3 [Daucus carota subsp. sativus]WOH03887.1 hypothetical protein DCAR_0623288 [Daucus carota subsp. sativus]
MCKSKMAVQASQPTPTPSRRSTTSTQTKPSSSSRAPQHSSSSTNTSSSSASSYRLDTSVATTSALSSLTSFRNSLPENPHIYSFSEIRAATNNFLAKRFSSTSSSPSWRATLRGKQVVIFQRNLSRLIQNSELKTMLSTVCRSHHVSIIKLLGASISADHIYLVYEFINGASLSDCLRNPRNPDFTVLSTWMSRIQIATDLAHGLDYIHNNTGQEVNLVHKYVKSSSVVVTEPSFNAKICHFGAAQICGESNTKPHSNRDHLPDSPMDPKRSANSRFQFEGVRGYMSPEFRLSGIETQKSDVYAFGVVLLELLSGEEPFKYRFEKQSGDYRRISVIDAAVEAVEGGGDTTEGRLRRWIDRRLKDSFPVDVAEKLTRLALECVEVEPEKRPNMGRVAGKISKLYLESRVWSEKVRVPTEFSVSFAPR